MTETSKHRSLVLPYLIGNGVDIGCGNDPVRVIASPLISPMMGTRDTTVGHSPVLIFVGLRKTFHSKITPSIGYIRVTFWKIST